MNVSHKHKIIWWAPERSATKITAQILKNFEFEYFEHNKITKKLCEPYYSHTMKIPKGCEDYKIICNMRNPYDRLLSLFINFTSVGKNSVLTRDNKGKFIKRFDYFTKELFYYAIQTNKIINLEKDKPIKDYLVEINFTDKLPDYFIRTENILEDLNKIDFVSQSNFWKSGEIEELVYNNNFKINRPYHFNEVFSLESANKIYQFQKRLFFLCEYDPFSFTTEILSDETKKKFLHETF